MTERWDPVEDRPYGSVPWHMAGRALAVSLRPKNRALLRQRLPAALSLPSDPIVRVRIWDLAHDAGLGRTATQVLPELTAFQEVAFAVPVSFGSLHGDFVKLIYADDPTYTAFGREVMGWPVRSGKIMVGRPWPGTPLSAGQEFTGYLERYGRQLLSISLTLQAPVPPQERPQGLPVWLSARSIPDPSTSRPALNQLIRGGPSEMRWGEMWKATATVALGSSPLDDLSPFAFSEVVAAQYWTGLDLTISGGEVLTDLDAPLASVTA
jgi:acetoacetate decarboxylase